MKDATISKVTILGEDYEVLDALNNITLADSFLKNKTGVGNGEAKLYVGNVSSELSSFFNDFHSEIKGFFLNKDLMKMLIDLKREYTEPQNHYYSKKTINGEKNIIDITKELPKKWGALHEKLQSNPNKLDFIFYKSTITPPRIYINSSSNNYKLLREIGIPNISYISVLKLKNKTGSIVYYFKPFVSYSNEIISYEQLSITETKELEEIESSNKSDTEITNLKTSRIGQGKYRELLLENMPFCPFTRINDERLLRASHIKPWVSSDNKEKIDPKNGLTLSPTYDVLFDRGFISFENDGSLLVSPFISPMNQKRLDIKNGKKINIEIFFDEYRINYLQYHRENIFQTV